MEEAWQVWLFLSTGALQIVVAYLWATARADLPRAPVVGLFLLNGGAMLMTSVALAYAQPTLTLIAETLDAWTNVFLLWCVCLVLPRTFRLALLATAFLLQFAATLSALLSTSDGGIFLREIPLLLAIAIASGTIVLGALGRLSSTRVQLLITAALGFRFAELAASVFVPNALRAYLDTGAVAAQPAVHLVVSSLLLLALLVASVAARTRSSEGPWSAVVVLLASGVALGLGHAASSASVAVYFTLMLLRPAFFVAIISDATGSEGIFRGRAGAVLGRAMAGVGLGTAGAALAPAWWDADMPSALAAAAGLAALVALVPPSRPRSIERRVRLPCEQGIDTSRVTLPPGWPARWAESRAAYAALPREARAGVDSLVRWQRLILALDACPPWAPGATPPWEATTAGLHALTLCPYASVGAELGRLQAREQEPVVRSSWGRVPGFQSARVKWYALTPAGRRLAERVRAESGLAGLPRAQLANVLSEGFREVELSRFDRPNEGVLTEAGSS